MRMWFYPLPWTTHTYTAIYPSLSVETKLGGTAGVIHSTLSCPELPGRTGLCLNMKEQHGEQSPSLAMASSLMLPIKQRPSTEA